MTQKNGTYACHGSYVTNTVLAIKKNTKDVRESYWYREPYIISLPISINIALEINSYFSVDRRQATRSLKTISEFCQ